MKKLLSVALVSTLAVGLGSSAVAADGGEKNGAFVGMHGGVTMFGISTYTADTNSSNTSATLDMGMQAGYQYFFMPVIGVRGYVAYDYDGSRDYNTAKLSLHNITFNVDALVNFINSDNFTFGVYAGVGLGYAIQSLSNSTLQSQMEALYNYNGFNIPINIGITATFAQHHKVEVGAKIQTLAVDSTLKMNNKMGFGFNPHVICMGYSFIF